MKALLSALACAFVLGCGAAPQEAASPCSFAAPCATGICVAGRCRAANAPPAKSGGSRVVLVPRDMAVLTADGEGDSSLPEAVALGRQGAGRAVILLRFASTWREDADIESAFFVIDTIDGAPLPITPPTAEIARILSPWTGATTSWGRRPRLSLPEEVGLLRAQPPASVRLDVTPQVRAWAARARDDHGLALLVEGSDPNGLFASTGLTKGLGPRLEVYLR